MPMSPERRREFDRLLRRERMRRTLRIGPPILAGAGLLAGFMWLRTHGAPPWIGLVIAGGAAFAKPAILMVRYFEQRRQRDRLD
jgi:hypothetical protein